MSLRPSASPLVLVAWCALGCGTTPPGGGDDADVVDATHPDSDGLDASDESDAPHPFGHCGGPLCGGDLWGRLGVGPGGTLICRNEDACRHGQLVAGLRGTYYIDPIGHVFAWGSPYLGVVETRLEPTEYVTFRGVLAVSGGIDSSCAVYPSGVVTCWGASAEGLGLGEDFAAPGGGTVPGVRDVVVLRHSRWYRGGACAVSADGSVSCWGSGMALDWSMAWSPVVHDCPPAVDVSIGIVAVCALTADEGVWCSDGVDGDFGEDERPDTRALAEVPGTQDAVGLDLGYAHACLVTASGEVRCWGHNLSGRLGVGVDADYVTLPTPVVGLPPARQVSAGFLGTCAVTLDDELWCWGDRHGAIALGGDPGQALPADPPTRVEELTDVHSVSLGFKHGCALTNTGVIWCWNTDWEEVVPSGDGTRDIHTRPVYVYQR